ncbi:hypothetical protein B0J17DRAFT_677911 [Rhizoctonia solani]|nr:hypothetical protein B0J17DRAFT_677911 [Rhizoctonia solani]
MRFIVNLKEASSTSNLYLKGACSSMLSYLEPELLRLQFRGEAFLELMEREVDFISTGKLNNL